MHEEHSSVAFGEHLEKLQEAGRAVVKTVKAAFGKGRIPTTDDVQTIASQLDKVAATVVAGRHATASITKCNHSLAEFITEEEAFFCNECRSTFARGARMTGCRQCDYDLCVACASSPSRNNNTRQWNCRME